MRIMIFLYFLLLFLMLVVGYNPIIVLLLQARSRQPRARGPDAACQGILPSRRPFLATILPSQRPFSFFNDRYAAINRRNNSHLIFFSLPAIRPKKA